MLSTDHDNKLFSRFLAKESSSSTKLAAAAAHHHDEASFRSVLYYGDQASGAAVPFVWETQPGTPKHRSQFHEDDDDDDDNPLPPLTPPPSYQLISTSTPKTKSMTRKSSKTNFLFTTLFPRNSIASKKNHVSPALMFSSSPSSSGSCSSSSTAGKPRVRRGWCF